MNPATIVRIREAAEHVQSRVPAVPRVGIVLGSGLGGFARMLREPSRLAYAEIPHMPEVSVGGHAGNLIVGRLGQSWLACLQGRVHLYEGHSVDQVVFGVWLLYELGCRAVLLTNAAGGIEQSISPGDLMLIVDHINLLGENPLAGPDLGSGARFVDMTSAYDPDFAELARRAADEQGILLREGVYAAVRGPNYETPAEVRMLRTMGADAVGMSTVPEVLALRYLGVRIAAMSCITNHAAGLTQAPLDHEEVQRVAMLVEERFSRLVSRWLLLIEESIT